MQATFPGGEFLRILFRFKKRRKIRRRMLTSSIKRQIRRFHVVVVQWTSKKCTKKRDARSLCTAAPVLKKIGSFGSDFFEDRGGCTQAMMHVQSCCFDHFKNLLFF